MIHIVYSTQHWIVPKIVIGILIVFLAAIIITEGMARVKVGEPFFKKPGKFFKDNCDYVKLFGTLILFIGYIACLNVIGFTITSIIFVFLFNVLYAGTGTKIPAHQYSDCGDQFCSNRSDVWCHLQYYPPKRNLHYTVPKLGLYNILRKGEHDYDFNCSCTYRTAWRGSRYHIRCNPLE